MVLRREEYWTVGIIIDLAVFICLRTICDLCSTRKICKLTTEPCKHVASELSNCGRALESELITRKICKETYNLLLHFFYFCFLPDIERAKNSLSQINLKSFISETPLAAFWRVFECKIEYPEVKSRQKYLTPSLHDTKRRCALWEWIDRSTLWRWA